MAPKVYGPVGSNVADYNSNPLPPPPIFDPQVYENVYKWEVIKENTGPAPGQPGYIPGSGGLGQIGATHPTDMVRKTRVIQSGYQRYLQDYKAWMILCDQIRAKNKIESKLKSALEKGATVIPMLYKGGSYSHITQKIADRVASVDKSPVGTHGASLSDLPISDGSSDGVRLVVVAPVSKPEPAKPDPNSARQQRKAAKKSYKAALATKVEERKLANVSTLAKLVADKRLSKLEERAAASVKVRATDVKKVNGSQPVDVSVEDGEWKLVVGKRASRAREKTVTIKRDSNGRPTGRKTVSTVAFESSAEED